MRFKKSPQLPGAGRTRAWHHHGSHMPTSPVKWPVNPNILAASVAARITYLGIIGVINQRQSFLFLCDSTLIQEVALICTLDNSHSMHLTIYTTLDQLDQEQYAVCLYWLLVYWSQN